MSLLLKILLVVVSCNVCCAESIKLIDDVTKDVGFDGAEGLVAAYGDFNSDHATDIFVVRDGGKGIDIYVWVVSELIFHKLASSIVFTDMTVQSIIPADFDGNGCMDLLVCMKKDGKNLTYVQVHWGDTKTLVKDEAVFEMQDQPSLVDANGDLLPDLFGTDTFGKRSYWISLPGGSDTSRGFHVEWQFDKDILGTLTTPHSNAFVDMTGDMHPDLLVKSLSENGKDNLLEIWTHEQEKNNLSLASALVIPIKDVKHFGQMSFADIDGDNSLDILLPVCLSDDCLKSAIYQYSVNSKKWSILLNNDHQNWQLSREDMTSSEFPFTIRFGDFTMDQHIDAVAILQNKGAKDGDEKSVWLLTNDLCSSNPSSGCEGRRTLTLRHQIEKKNPVMASLMDVYENGPLDLILVSRYQTDAKKYSISVYKNEFSVDATFLKVAVLSGRCYKNCACRKSTPYGANQIGAMVEYSTADTDGKPLSGKGCQWSQSAYYALQTPYVVFGLGKSPNFVDSLKVGIPQGIAKNDRVHSWSAIIPNAQVIVIPYPMDQPDEWMTKLLVTPSKLLVQTAGVLLGTCLLVAGLILILHMKEKKEDEREKRKEAHKFHFDAL